MRTESLHRWRMRCDVDDALLFAAPEGERMLEKLAEEEEIPLISLTLKLQPRMMVAGTMKVTSV